MLSVYMPGKKSHVNMSSSLEICSTPFVEDVKFFLRKKSPAILVFWSAWGLWFSAPSKIQKLLKMLNKFKKFSKDKNKIQ